MSGCAGCKSKCGEKMSKGCCSDNETCDCSKKLAVANKQAIVDDGVWCLVCNDFKKWAEPNRCNGTFVCSSCRSTKAYLIPPGHFL